jgi:prolycopene isomerase
MSSPPAGSPSSHYDAVIIGSGAAGLTCATRLAQAGVRTLLAEKNDWVGGYSHGFAQDGFYWDHGGHIFLAYRLGAQARKIFQRLRLAERVQMVPLKYEYRCIFPDESLAVPADITEAADAMAARFPAERDGIAKVLLTMEGLIDQVDQFVPAFRFAEKPGERRFLDPVFEAFARPRLGAFGARLARTFGLPGASLLKYQSRTMKELLDEHLKDPRLKAYFSMLSAGIGFGPASLSAVLAGVFFIHALRTMWMPKGGFGALADGLAGLFQESGGTLMTNCPVGRILVERGRAAGIETADGRRFSADCVVSACDARTTFLKMLEPQHVPASLRDTMAKMALSPSIFQVHLGLDMDIVPLRDQVKRLNFFYPSSDIDQAMVNFEQGNVDDAAFFLYVATYHQPEMAPPGKHSVKLEAYTRLDARGIDWERDKDRLADVFIRRSEALIPGMSRHIISKHLRTPADLRRDTGNSEGAYAGWAFSPALISYARPRQRTKVPGLYLAGHWATPTAGVPWVMLSGYNTAGMVMTDKVLRPKLAGRPQPPQA